jgi:nicotinamidase-related amidase
MLLDRARSQLLVVDVQERLMPAMHAGETMAERCGILMQSAHRLGIPVTISEQYRKGLGPTIARLGNLKGDAPVLEKVHFSCAEDDAIVARVNGLATAGRSQVLVCGIESHVCVLQSALGFKERFGFEVAVAADAVTSRQPASVALAFDRMRGAGVSVVNTEMALFEWLHRAGTPEFKELSPLIR